MVQINFSAIEDSCGFEPIPDGRYLCEVEDVSQTTNRNGDEMWKLRFRVTDGPYIGRAVFDNLVFSPMAHKRVKLVCRNLGLDVSGEVDLTPEMLYSKRCILTVYIRDYTDKDGETRTINYVPFDGYSPAPELS